MRRCLSVAILGIALSGAILGQQDDASIGNKLSDILTRMNSADLHASKIAFDELMTQLASDGSDGGSTTGLADAASRFLARHPQQADQVKLGLIQLLGKENYFFIETKNPPPDPYEEDNISDHYADLISVVSSLDDERAIPVLVGAMTTGGIAQRGLLKYGDKALEPVIAQLSSSDALVRATALGMSITLLERRHDVVSDARIRYLIRSSLADPKPVVRRHAIKEIDCLNDRQAFVPILERIAKSDPWKLPGKADDGGDGEEFYPVRFQARWVLRDIQSNKTCAP